MGKIVLSLKKFKQEGDIRHEYQPLHNIVNSDGQIVDFDTDELDIDLNNPVNIECQPSYDGTVNLILNDDKNPPRIINTRFTKIEDNRYKVINRNQIEQTNLYKEGRIDQQTRLFRNINTIPRIDLMKIYNMGQMKGGNYTFYIKFADNDYNQTDVVAESGQVSIFKGYLTNISSISGAIMDELTDKAVTIKISNIDTSFSKVYVYFVRETCDTNGVALTKAGYFTKPYEITDDTLTITLNGFEDVTEITPEEINIQYNLVTAVKTQAQVQNMLFFGNVQGINLNLKDLQNISYYIPVELHQDETVGWIDPETYLTKSGSDSEQTEYYSPYNIYYKLGYWPEEIYRLGIVYIMNDDSLSPVFNLRGCRFTADSEDAGDRSFSERRFANFIPSVPSDDKLVSLHKVDGSMNYLERDDFITNSEFLDNTFGVFKNPKANVYDYSERTVKPLYYKITLTNEVVTELKKNKVKGYFIVRQKRIPTILCQGLSVGVDRISHVPMLYGGNEHHGYFTESFIDSKLKLTTDYRSRIIGTEEIQSSGLLSVDANATPQLHSTFDGSNFILEPYHDVDYALSKTNKDRYYYIMQQTPDLTNMPNRHITASVSYVGPETPLKYINGYGFSTKAGTQEDVSQFSFFASRDYSDSNYKLVRGLYCPFLGTNVSLQKNTIYNVRVSNYNQSLMRDYFMIRGKSTLPFFAVTDRYALPETSSSVNVFRGDCYTNTVTIRLNRNFIDSEVPINEYIVDPDCWSENYKGYGKMVNGESTSKKKGNWADINRADVNTVPLGIWVTYKCLSSRNLGIRAEDKSNTQEMALMGSARTFYPFSYCSVAVSHKIEESYLLNSGYSSTVGYKRNIIADNVPYTKELFDSRIMFSNVQREDNFRNAYRIFQGLAFKDIDRQYGAIVKLIPWGTNLFCVFEHGLGIIPINEKALIQTTTGQSIHMYGAGVIQNQITLINADFGSIWPESVIRTLKGIYGVDTYAKKIWRFSQNKGLEVISDMKVQRFLNENIKLKEEDKYTTIALKNVKTHFNNFKGDLMFTFYNSDQDTTWNLCYNERTENWITRYSWTPLYSENINNIFYSLDKDRAKVLSYIYDNQNCTYGIRVENSGSQCGNEWVIPNSESAGNSCLNTGIHIEGHTISNNYKITIKSIETSFLMPVNSEISENAQDIKAIYSKEVDETYKEVGVLITGDTVDNLFTISDGTDYAGPHLLTSATYDTMKSYFLGNGGKMPVWFKLNIEVTFYLDRNPIEPALTEAIGIVVDNLKLKNTDNALYNKEKRVFLQNGFYVHGRAGIFNEMDYEDQYFNNQILPAKWYERQEPFEFEFVVNDVVGAHKIFDNLVIISNNVQPNQIEYEITGDVYDFNKTGIFRHKAFGENVWNTTYNKPKFLGTVAPPRSHSTTNTYQSTQEFYNCDVKWDTVLNEYTLVCKQDCKNFKTYGRRLGNIQYKEDAWYLTIDPIKYKETYRINGAVDEHYSKNKEVRLRDKFIKIRVKYTGEDIVIITALKTILTQSYA